MTITITTIITLNITIITIIITIVKALLSMWRELLVTSSWPQIREMPGDNTT